ncbi:MAG: GNAT family N-acetyltransferase [Candidatus Acidiferrales bacterium]
MVKVAITMPVAAQKEATEAAIAALRSHSAKAGGVLTDEEPFSILAFAEERIVGGLIGKVFWNWLYADLVWVEEEFRGPGIGTNVMKRAEERAMDMKLTGIYLWTENWQAPAFYSRLGYKQFVEFRDFPPGHSRFGFHKYVSS